MRLYYTDDELRPFRAHTTDAGVDLRAGIRFNIAPRELKVIPTGVKAEIGIGYYGQLAERSSLAAKGIMIIGGVIDSEYRGEIKVLMVNAGSDVLRFEKGDRIAQLIEIPIGKELAIEKGEPDKDTVRGCKGFGSSGL